MIQAAFTDAKTILAGCIGWRAALCKAGLIPVAALILLGGVLFFVSSPFVQIVSSLLTYVISMKFVFSVTRIMLFGPNESAIWGLSGVDMPDQQREVLSQRFWLFLWCNVRLIFITLGWLILLAIPFGIVSVILSLVVDETVARFMVMPFCLAALGAVLLRHFLILPAVAEGGPHARYVQAYERSNDKKVQFFLTYFMLQSGVILLVAAPIFALELLGMADTLLVAMLSPVIDAVSSALLAATNCYFYWVLVGDSYDYIKNDASEGWKSPASLSVADNDET